VPEVSRCSAQTTREDPSDRDMPKTFSRGCPRITMEYLKQQNKVALDYNPKSKINTHKSVQMTNK
jgi:hypothetical protein